jgi:hypothetical protein
LNRVIRERLATLFSEELAIYAEGMAPERVFPLHAANLRSPSQSVRNPTTWFQLGVTRDAGPEITNGLGAFLYLAASEPGFGQAFSLERD